MPETSTRKKPKGTVKARLRRPKYDWPDPPMVPTTILRRCADADSIEEVRAIVNDYLKPVEGRAL